MSTQEQLADIKERLGDLPQRLAAVLQYKMPQRDAQGRYIGAGGNTPTAPSLWNSSERLGHALGQFIPVFGQLAGLMGAVREVDSAWKQFKVSWRGSSTNPALPSVSGLIGARYSPSLPAPPVRSTLSPQAPQLPSTAMPTVAPLPTPTMPSLAPGFRIGSSPLSEVTLQQLMMEIRKNTEMLRQQDADETEDTERVPAKEILEGPETEQAEAKLYQPPRREADRPQFSGPFRPKVDVPSGSEDLNKKTEAAGSVLKALI